MCAQKWRKRHAPAALHCHLKQGSPIVLRGAALQWSMETVMLLLQYLSLLACALPKAHCRLLLGTYWDQGKDGICWYKKGGTCYCYCWWLLVKPLHRQQLSGGSRFLRPPWSSNRMQNWKGAAGLMEMWWVEIPWMWEWVQLLLMMMKNTHGGDGFLYAHAHPLDLKSIDVL